MQERDNFYDCIRALAATLVFLTHSGILSGGSIGVSIFFCLSGFLITRILLRLPELSIGNVAKFIFRRFMRVWPLMIFQILLTVATVAWLYPEHLASYARDIVPMGTFSRGYSFFVYGGGSPLLLWTLRAEFWFYVFYPLVLMAVGRKRLPWVALTGIGLSWYLKLAYGHAGPGLGPFNYTLIYLDQLMYGALCAFLIERNNGVARAIFRNRMTAVWLPFVGILVLSTLSFKGYDWTWYAETSAAALLTAPMILHQWAQPLRGDYEPIATIGRISYSIYLLHVMVLEHLFPHAFPQALEFFLRCGGVICFSLLTYRFIELPFIALSKRIAPLSRRHTLENAQNFVEDNRRLKDRVRTSTAGV
jgi:peptidoglycan/LPS O-acetylase OafA/YrhL